MLYISIIINAVLIYLFLKVCHKTGLLREESKYFRNKLATQEHLTNYLVKELERSKSVTFSDEEKQRIHDDAVGCIIKDLNI